MPEQSGTVGEDGGVGVRARILTADAQKGMPVKSVGPSADFPGPT